MNDEKDDAYLWDRSGEPDADVVRLERTLGRLRHDGVMPALARRAPRPSSFPRGRTLYLLAAAAVIVIAAGTWLILALQPTWRVRTVAGVPVVDGRGVSGNARIGIGEWLITDAASRARVSVGQIGSVEVDANTRVQLLAAGSREHRLSLERGTIHARIWAPPRFFFVNTPAAVAVDLGCAYTLHVDDSGAGLLRVTDGWVGFEADGRESFIPEGAMCATRPGIGPGTPRFEDAPSGYAAALDVLDFAPASDPRRLAAFELVLSQARPRDALTLWHLLARGTPEERARVYERMVTLAPPPPDVTREAILRGDRQALHAWWDAIGMGNTTWWRFFKKKW